jgi:hypothetical protein
MLGKRRRNHARGCRAPPSTRTLSDEILHLRRPLVYSIGDQHPLPDRERRCLVIEATLLCTQRPEVRDQLDRLLGLLSKRNSVGAGAPDEFDGLQLFRTTQLRALLPQINSVVLKALWCAPPNCLQWMRDIGAVYEVFEPAVCDGSMDISVPDGLSSDQRSDVLVLRGLLAGGILWDCLTMRHRVEYGVPPDRKKCMAVPYRAADTPSLRRCRLCLQHSRYCPRHSHGCWALCFPRAALYHVTYADRPCVVPALSTRVSLFALSEFERLDRTIALTLLSFYSTGLSQAQLLDAFKSLLDKGPSVQVRLGCCYWARVWV